ncbi:MAG TPA: DNA polymerase, partial [Nitrospira sp.]|nr:DNA polymerase [Nitrospira sp.]
NNCVRTRPPENRDPTRVEMEACRPSVERDILATKPKAIFGFGNIPLKWAFNESHISTWRGRRLPINVKGHKCWYYPMLHPAFIGHKEKKFSWGDGYRSDEEFAFHLDLKRAFAELPDLPEPIIHTKEQALTNIRIIEDPVEAIGAIRSMRMSKVVGLDYETNCLRPYSEGSRILTIALANEAEAVAFPLDHSQCWWSEPEKKRVADEFERFLYEAPCIKIAHHLTFEMEWAAYFFGPDCLHTGTWGCSESQAYILDERSDKSGGGRSLHFLCLQRFGLPLKDITGNLDRLNLDKAPLPKVLQYNGLDAKYHRLLYLEQEPLLAAEGLTKVYQKQLNRAPTAVLTQLSGIPLNPSETRKLQKQYRKKIEKIEGDIKALEITKRFRKLKGHDYRPSAPQDVAFVCRRILQVETEKVDEAALSKIKHPIVKHTLRWRKANKLLSTYVEPCLPGSQVLFPDGMLHPITGITTTDTWRTSSEAPNYQNWPKRNKEAKEVRRQVEVEPGYKIVSVDFAGIQARNVAMESKDAALINAFWNDYDIHSDWRDRAYKKYPKWMTKEQRADKDEMKAFRNVAKNGFVFPSFFGAQVPKLSRVMNIPEEYIVRLVKDFWEEFPDIKQWHERIFKTYHEKGYVTGLTGFRRRAPISPNQIINAPIQSDEALIVCEAMYRLSKLNDDYLQARLEIHDDLTFIFPNKKVDHYIDIITKEMTRPIFKWINVPIVVEVSIGQNWADMEEIKDKFSSANLWSHKP